MASLKYIWEDLVRAWSVGGRALLALAGAAFVAGLALCAVVW